MIGRARGVIDALAWHRGRVVRGCVQLLEMSRRFDEQQEHVDNLSGVPPATQAPDESCMRARRRVLAASYCGLDAFEKLKSELAGQHRKHARSPNGAPLRRPSAVALGQLEIRHIDALAKHRKVEKSAFRVL